MPIDYAIGVGTFVPNNAVIIHHDVLELMADGDEEARHQAHDLRMHAARLHLRAGQRRSEDGDPRRDRQNPKIQTGYQVDGITGGLGDKAQK